MKSISRLFAVLFTFVGFQCLPLAAADPPNIVVFLADDLGWGDLGSYGHPVTKTPNLDRLADQGLRLTDCHSGASICSPSRGAILTGRQPARLGIYGLCGNVVHLRDEETTIPEILKQHGYTTYFSGKWHLGDLSTEGLPDPGQQGFDHWYATNGNAGKSTLNPKGFREDGRLLDQQIGYYCDLVVDRGVRWLKERDTEKPFFLEICSSETHTPITPAPEFAAMYDNDETRALERQIRRGGIPLPPWQLDRPELSRLFYGLTTQLDAAVGTLLKGLDELGVAENTLVFFTSDNGPEYHEWIFPDRRTYGSTGGFRGGKRFLYEGGIRVPGIVRWPARIKPGRVSDELVSGVDLLPTICDLVGAELPKDRVIDGASLLPLFDGGKIDRKQPLLWHQTRIDIPQFSMRIGDEVLLGYLEKPKPGQGTAHWMRTGDLDRVEYYDLELDPYQHVELSEAGEARYWDLHLRFERALAQLREDMPVWKGDVPSRYPIPANVNWRKADWNYQFEEHD